MGLFLTAAPPFAVRVQPDRERVIVAVIGEIDLFTAGDVGTEVRTLLDRGFDAVVVDLRAVTFLESTGVRTLLECEQAARGRGASLTVRGVHDGVRRPLELTGVLGRLEGDDAA